MKAISPTRADSPAAGRAQAGRRRRQQPQDPDPVTVLSATPPVAADRFPRRRRRFRIPVDRPMQSYLLLIAVLLSSRRLLSGAQPRLQGRRRPYSQPAFPAQLLRFLHRPVVRSPGADRGHGLGGAATEHHHRSGRGRTAAGTARITAGSARTSGQRHQEPGQWQHRVQHARPGHAGRRRPHYRNLQLTATPRSGSSPDSSPSPASFTAWRAISPTLRARNRVERVVTLLLIVSSTVAIFTTIGIVLSVLFESIRFSTRCR
jgi:hypothetical protein